MLLERLGRTAALLLVLGTATGAPAATLRISPSGTDAGTACASSAPCKTFGYAISQASVGDTISAAAGTYVENLTISKNLTLKGENMGSTILDGNAADRVLYVQFNTTVSLSELTIQNGATTGDGGAGIFNNGALTLDHVMVSNNHAAGGMTVYDSGGGITNNGTLTLTSSFVSNNSAENWGGALYNKPGTTATIIDTTIANNQAAEAGGGVYNAADLTFTHVEIDANISSNLGGGVQNAGASCDLTDVSFAGNTAVNGGGLYNIQSDVALTRAIFSGNTCSGAGGAMWNDESTTALKDVTFIGNLGTNGGGAIFNQNTSNLTLSNVTFDGNATNVFGGAILTQESVVDLTNVTFSNNHARMFYGGGLSVFAGSTVNLMNVTFSGNSASAGAALHTGGSPATVNLTNTIVANSSSGGNCSGTFVSLGHNLDSDNTCGFSVALKDQIGVDPLLSQLADNGGFTRTMALAKKSPAIDKGADNGCPSKDQRGKSRPIDGDKMGAATCDIGAFEYKP
jgi:hypothetical protein